MTETRMNPYRVIKGPHVSEKAVAYTQESNTYTFQVDATANKCDIKAAVETLWDVKVTSVRTLKMPGKIKRFGRTVGRSNPWKKAVVRLADGQAIESLR